MTHDFVGEFCFIDWNEVEDTSFTDVQRYAWIVDWARRARGCNPNAFDALTDWLRDDTLWSDHLLGVNERLLMQDVIARFRHQNSRLRALLEQLESTGIVNAPVFAVLDRFDEELSGNTHDPDLNDTVAQVFADFSIMRDSTVRAKIAGERTGPTGTDSADIYGYINYLKNCDAQVQWTLFMPGLVEQQQRGFKVESFEYRTLPAMRFIGLEADFSGDGLEREECFAALNAMSEHASGFDHDILFMHHYGLGVDVEPWHGVWGRFMQAESPVPEGFLYFDFVENEDDAVGPPYLSQFALATFSGDIDAMHEREGYDSDAMYDVTRNIILGEGVCIPYPGKYWTAEVFLDGGETGTVYLFGVALNPR
ncbi:MAG: hypothetical protein M9909_01460 [Thermomicrobiales bacterium]|nr:hypothetical protein [Thermomicrobiales bacterium]